MYLRTTPVTRLGLAKQEQFLNLFVLFYAVLLLHMFSLWEAQFLGVFVCGLYTTPCTVPPNFCKCLEHSTCSVVGALLSLFFQRMFKIQEYFSSTVMTRGFWVAAYQGFLACKISFPNIVKLHHQFLLYWWLQLVLSIWCWICCCPVSFFFSLALCGRIGVCFIFNSLLYFWHLRMCVVQCVLVWTRGRTLVNVNNLLDLSNYCQILTIKNLKMCELCKTFHLFIHSSSLALIQNTQLHFSVFVPLNRMIILIHFLLIVKLYWSALPWRMAEEISLWPKKYYFGHSNCFKQGEIYCHRAVL